MFRALVAGGPQTPHELAERAGLAEPYVREWLGRQAARGHVMYDPTAEIFLLTPQQEAWLGGYACAATSASWRSDMPITARCPSTSSR